MGRDAGDVNQYFSGGWLKAADMPVGKEYKLTIKDWDITEPEPGKKQPCLSFEQTDKKLGLNKTNALIIADLVGSAQMRDWIGHTIKIKRDKTTFKGRPTDCVRVVSGFIERSAEGARLASAPAAPVEDDADPFTGGELSEDDIPF